MSDRDEWPAGSGGHRRPFGDGDHPSTRLAMRGLLEQLASRRRGASVLDAGSGSGRLSETAIALGAVVTAVDRDPASAAMTARRARGAEVICGELEKVLEPESHDIVVANLDERQLIRLAPWLRRAVRDEGALVMTGVLLCRAGFLRRQFASGRFTAFLGYAALSWAKPPRT